MSTSIYMLKINFVESAISLHRISDENIHTIAYIGSNE